MKLKNIAEKSNKYGYTLVELMLYIALAAVILTAITMFLNLTMMNKVKNQAIIEVEQQGYHTMQVLTSAIRNATSLTSPSRGNSSSSLVLNSGTYAVSSNKLQVTSGSTADITSSVVQVSGLNFQNVSKDSARDVIKIRFTVSYDNPSTRNERDYSQTFYGSASKRQ